MFIYFVLIFQQLIASGTHIVAKLVVNDIDPFTLTMLRSAVAAIVILGMMAVRKVNFRFDRGDRIKIIFLSALAVPVNQFLFLYAIRYTTPANAALLYGMTPAIVLTISIFIGRERLVAKRLIGVVIAFMGVILVIFEKGLKIDADYTRGNIIIFIAVMAWALYTVYGRDMILKYGAFKAGSVTMVLGTVLYFPVGITETVQFSYGTLNLYHWAGILYLAVMTSIFAYLLWYYALGRIEASRVTIFMNLQPVFTTILSVIVIGQSLSLLFIAGGVMVLGGVFISQRG